jgi:hypothetical protein
VYIGQTGEQFRIRYNEHLLALIIIIIIIIIIINSSFAQYLIKDGHSMENIDGIMYIVYITRKGRPTLP